MAMMMGKLYAALIEANVSEEHARDAAEEIAAFDAVRLDISALRGKVDLLAWMVSFVIAILLLGFGKLIFGH